MEKEITLNFGAIQESILRLSSRDFSNNERKALELFNTSINENPTLKLQQLIFNSFNTNKQFEKQRLAERFIYQTLEILNNVSWGLILTTNRDIRITFLDNTHVGSTTNKDFLYNAIHNLMESRCLGVGNYDIQKEQKSFDVVLDFLMSEKIGKQVVEKKDEPKISWRYVTQFSIGSFYERYSHLSESDIKLMRLLTSENYLKECFLTYSNFCKKK